MFGEYFLAPKGGVELIARGWLPLECRDAKIFTDFKRPKGARVNSRGWLPLECRNAKIIRDFKCAKGTQVDSQRLLAPGLPGREDDR